MIAVTGASGQLGRLVIEELIKKIPVGDIVALVRDPGKAADLAAKGVVVRKADYNQPASLEAALNGVEKLLLISSNDLGGNRATQHKAVISSAKKAGVKLVAYTSVLNADSSPMLLAHDHKETEPALKASGLQYVILRNGWYNENWWMAIQSAPQHGAVIGCAGNGKFSAASRADYAAAAATVLTTEGHAGKTYELGGDTPFTLSDLAAEIAKQSSKPVAFNNLPEAAYKAALASFGLPEILAGLLADSDSAASKGALFNDSGTLGKLIGRPATPISSTVSAALKG